MKSTIDVDVRGLGEDMNEQVRAYAEYRMFTRFASMGRDLRHIRVRITTMRDGTTICAASAVLADGPAVHARARSHGPALAVDLTAARLAEAAVWQFEKASR